MVGGTEAAFERGRPLFELMGQNITLVGETGAGQTCKVANQIVVALTIEAVGEALLFASKAGVDPARVREALMGGFAGSKILEVHGERMIKRSFDPGFRIELHQKDLNLALAGARALGVSLPNTASTQELFNACAGQGWSGLDHSAMARAAATILSASDIGRSAGLRFADNNENNEKRFRAQWRSWLISPFSVACTQIRNQDLSSRSLGSMLSDQTAWKLQQYPGTSRRRSAEAPSLPPIWRKDNERE